MMKLIRERRFLTVLVNTFSQLINRLSGSFTTFIITILISYSLGLSSFGSFIKIITFVTFFYLLIDFGINSMYIKKHFETAGKNFGNLIALRLLIAFVLWILIGSITFLLPYNASTNSGFSLLEKIGIFIYSFTLFTQALEQSINTIFQKELLFKHTIIPNILSSLVLILIVLSGILSKNLLLIVASYPISEVVVFLASYIILSKKVTLTNSLNEFKKFSQELVKSSFPLALMIFFNVIYFRADTLILALLKPTAQVGSYGLSYKIFEVVITLPAFFANSVFPILIEKQGNKKEFRDHVRTYSLFLLALSFIAIPCIYFSSPLLSVIKPEFANSVQSLRILSYSLPFFFLTSLFQWILIIRNKQKILVTIYAFSMVVNVILNLVYIPQFSYTASSYITVISEGLVLLLIGLVFLGSKDEIF